MRRLLDSELELFVESDFIYLPLLLDPSIEKETQSLFQSGSPGKNTAQPESKTIIKHNTRHFVKTINVHSLLDSYKAINTHHYNRLRDDCLRKYRLTQGADGIFVDETLKKILFLILPHFVRNNKNLRRRKLAEEEVLDFIAERIDIPQKYHEDALAFLDLEPLHEILRGLEDRKPVLKPPGEGLQPASKLRAWFHEAIQAKVLADERYRVKKALQVRQQLSREKPEHIAIFLYIADMGSIEIDGFGFSRMKFPKEYLIYKRTGEYVLRDYYGRSYLFPDCRVAVSTYTPSRPFVVEKYKHPFLRGYQANQEICMKAIEVANEPTASNIIRILEEGITALLYGYDARRRNGYHSLDKTFVYIPTIAFEEYRI